MDKPTGRGVSLVDSDNGARSVIAVDVAAARSRRAAGKGCGAGLLTGGRGERQVEASVRAGLDLATDDVVEISLAPDNLLHAAIIVYGLPMLGASIGAVIAFGLSLGDAAAAVSAMIGLGCGLLISRWRLQQESCLSRFVPTIERRV